MSTAVYLYLDIETIPTFNDAVIAEIRSKHVVAEPDLGAIRAAANLKDEAKIAEDIEKRKQKAVSDWEEAQGKADIAYDEAIRKTCLDATTGHIACVSLAFDGCDVDHVVNPTLIDFAENGAELSLENVQRGERFMLQELFNYIENTIDEALMGQLLGEWNRANVGRRSSMTMTDAAMEKLAYLEAKMPSSRRTTVPIVVAHHAAFDVRYIWQRCVILGVPIPAWWPHDAKPWDVERIDDTMLLWAGQGGRIGLDRLCRALGIPGKGDFDGSMVWDAVQRGEIDKVVDYCDDDVRRLRAVHQRIRGLETPAPVAAVAAE